MPEANAFAVSGFVPSSPQVMLSPKARNDIAVSFGGAVTVTRKLHVSDLSSVSVAVHVTVVFPTSNSDPEDGVHIVVRGGEPLLAVAAP